MNHPPRTATSQAIADDLRADRYRKFRHMGAYVESGDKDRAPKAADGG